MSVAVNSAIFSLICQTALKATADYARTNALTYAESQRLIDFICERTNPRPPETSVAHPSPGRVEGVHTRTTVSRDVATSTRSEVEGGGNGSSEAGESGEDRPRRRGKVTRRHDA